MNRNVRIAKELVKLAKSLVAGGKLGGIPAEQFNAIPMTSGWYDPPDEDDYMETTGLFTEYDKNYRKFLEDLKDAGWEEESCKYDDKKGIYYAYLKIRPLDKRPNGQPPVDFKYLCDECNEDGTYYLEDSYDDNDYNDKYDTSFNVYSAKQKGDNVLELKHYRPEPDEETWEDHIKDLDRYGSRTAKARKADYPTFSQKQIKNWYNATDVTDARELPEKWKIVGISTGLYGVNGCVYTDKEGNFYKITKRCSNLFRII